MLFVAEAAEVGGLGNYEAIDDSVEGVFTDGFHALLEYLKWNFAVALRDRQTGGTDNRRFARRYLPRSGHCGRGREGGVCNRGRIPVR